MKLTPEQLEDILRGEMPQPEDLDPADLDRLAEARAIRGRLRTAFDSVTAPEGLADRIRAELQTADQAPADESRGRILRFPRRFLAVVSAAAAVLVIGMLVHNLTTPEPAVASTVQMADIHRANLASPEGFCATGDCEQIKAYFQEKVGFVPKLLTACPELKVIGCCVARLNGRTVATYVAAVEDRKVSIIVTEAWPKKLGLECGCGMPHCRCIHNGQCEGLSIASARIGDRSYSVVGDLPEDALRGVLERLQR